MFRFIVPFSNQSVKQLFGFTSTVTTLLYMYVGILYSSSLSWAKRNVGNEIWGHHLTVMFYHHLLQTKHAVCLQWVAVTQQNIIHSDLFLIISFGKKMKSDNTTRQTKGLFVHTIFEWIWHFQCTGTEFIMKLQ